MNFRGNGRTALHRSAYWGKVDCLETCLNWGADVNSLDCKDETPLQDALAKGNIDCVKLLLIRGIYGY